jgi:hypothetical protein
VKEERNEELIYGKLNRLKNLWLKNGEISRMDVWGGGKYEGKSG